MDRSLRSLALGEEYHGCWRRKPWRAGLVEGDHGALAPAGLGLGTVSPYGCSALRGWHFPPDSTSRGSLCVCRQAGLVARP